MSRSYLALGALLAVCTLPLARGDCCFASAVTSSYVPACNDCTAPEGLLSTCGVASCNIFGCGCSGGCRTGCQMDTANGQTALMCAAPDAPDGTSADTPAAAPAPAAEGMGENEGRRRRLRQSEDAAQVDALATDGSAAPEDASASEAETELLGVTGESGNDTAGTTTAAALPPCRPPTSATAPADIFFYFLCLDADTDGFITFEEACTNGLPGCANALDAGDNSTLAGLRTQFLALDANADGQLSPAEFDAELDGYLPYGNSTEVAPSPEAEVVPTPVPVTPATTSAGSRSRLFATGAAVVTALLAFINA